MQIRRLQKRLKKSSALLKLNFVTHSYPHDWRTKKPVIFRATAQWFASIETFREELLGAIKETKFTPSWGETRLYNMVRDRGDWCISRQRVWGVPIPVFYGEDGEPIITDETIAHVSKLFREHGSNIWFERDAIDLLPEGFTHEGSPNGQFTKETDIMDVWFDSGSSHQGVLDERDDLVYPADLYLEGSDQYRGWFNSSLTISVAINGHAPYKGLLSHGFTLDKNGRKMSKSLGNTIVPAKVMNQMGADILRLWVSSVDYTADVRVSDSNFKQVSEVYRKIRNTFRFIHGNTSDFNPATDSVAFADLRPVDKYVYVKLQDLIKEVHAAYENYEFAGVYHAVNNFCTGVLSSLYLDIAKDVVYIENMNHPHRRAMQTVMYETLMSLVKVLTPILPHTADEIWAHFEHVTEESVQLTDMPEAQDFGEEAIQIREQFETLMAIRDDVLKALEVARNDKVIGKSLEAKVTIYVPEELKDVFKAEDIDFAQFFIVSKFAEGDVVNAPEQALKLDTVSVLVEEADGEKCERCWTISETVGTDETHPEICARCADVVKKHYALTE